MDIEDAEKVGGSYYVELDDGRAVFVAHGSKTGRVGANCPISGEYEYLPEDSGGGDLLVCCYPAKAVARYRGWQVVMPASVHRVEVSYEFLPDADYLVVADRDGL